LEHLSCPPHPGIQAKGYISLENSKEALARSLPGLATKAPCITFTDRFVPLY
jgi:hypothetical protein